MSKLLIDEPPLQVLPRLAVTIGLYEAIILQQMHYWLEINKKVGRNFKSGYFWTFNSYDGWHEQFPFMSRMTIRRAIGNLRKQKLLITANFNPHKFDNTLWYRINYDAVHSLELVSVGQESHGQSDHLGELDKKKNTACVLDEHTMLVGEGIIFDVAAMEAQLLRRQELKKKKRNGNAREKA